MGCSSWSMTLIYSISWAIMSWFCIVLLSTSALQVRVFLSYLALNKPEGSWSTKELYFYVVVVQSLSHVRFYDTMARSTQDCPALYYLPESVQIHIHWVDDAVQPSNPLLPPSPSALNHSQHQGLFQWVGCLHQVAEVLELQHQSFQWIFRVGFL